MANAIYSGWKQLIGRHGIGIDQAAVPGVFSVGLVSTSYTFSQAHDFLDDIAAGGGTIVAVQSLEPSATFTGRTLDANDVTFPALSGVAVKALLFYMNTGTASTSRLVAYLDTNITGIPFTPTGADAVLSFDAVGIFDL